MTNPSMKTILSELREVIARQVEAEFMPLHVCERCGNLARDDESAIGFEEYAQTCAVFDSACTINSLDESRATGELAESLTNGSTMFSGAITESYMG